MAEELLPSVNLEGVFTEQTFLMVVMWFLLIIGVVIFVFFCVIGIWYLTYRIRIRYYQPVGIDKDGKSILRFIGTDKAKIIKLKGNIYNIRYFWKRKKDEPPPTEAYLPTKKGYEMHVMTNGIDFFPMMLRSNPGFEVVPMHKRLWLVQTHKDAMEQYSKPSFWEKYGSLILTFGTIVLVLAMVSLAIWYNGKLMVYNIDKAAATAIEISKMKIVPG